MNLQVPVLFLIFNRPDTTAQVFEQIRKVKPTRLFIGADGPRSSKENEKELCEKTRATVLDNIDWHCEVKKLFRDENLGCGRAVSEAITWFFNEVEEGIILEDDTLPDETFFPYCEELLEKYRHDERIMIVSGANLLNTWHQEDSSYFFSKYAGIWGWASWRRAWKGYDLEMTAWKNTEIQRLIKKQFHLTNSSEYISKVFDAVSNKLIDTWDYQWWFHRLIHSGLGIIPSVNLVMNIGFGINATNTYTISEEISGLKKYSIKPGIIAPPSIMVDEAFDEIMSSKFFNYQASPHVSILTRIRRRLSGNQKRRIN